MTAVIVMVGEKIRNVYLLDCSLTNGFEDAVRKVAAERGEDVEFEMVDGGGAINAVELIDRMRADRGDE